MRILPIGAALIFFCIVGCRSHQKQPAPSNETQSTSKPEAQPPYPELAPVAPWVPPKSDLVRIGAVSNIVSIMGKTIMLALADANEFDSLPHANFALQVFTNYHCSDALGDAVNIVSGWPDGPHKDNAKVVLKYLSRLTLVLSKSIGLARAGQYQDALQELSDPALDSRKLMDGMIELLSSSNVPNWEAELKRQILMVDWTTKTLHQSTCTELGKKALQIEQKEKELKRAAFNSLKLEPWANDEPTVKSLFDWLKRSTGSRGPCPVVLRTQLKEAFLPIEQAVFIPVYIKFADSYKRCPVCEP